MDIIKNPVVLGAVAAIIAYLYLLWGAEKKYTDDKKAKKSVGLFIPLIVGIITCVIAYCVFYSSPPQASAVIIDPLAIASEPIIGTIGAVGTVGAAGVIGASNGVTTAIVPKQIVSDDSSSFHLISKSGTIPSNPIEEIPDVFLETFD